LFSFCTLTDIAANYFILRDIWDSHKDDAKDWSLLAYQAVSTSRYIPTFRSVLLPLFSESAISRPVTFSSINRHFFELLLHEDEGTKILRIILNNWAVYMA